MDVKFAPAGQLPEAPERLSKKPAKRRVQIERATSLFESGRDYTESEVNILLMPLFEDHVFVRRLLIEQGTLDRTPTGSKYWVKQNS